MSRTLFVHASELITNSGARKKNGIGIQEADLGIISDGALLWDEDYGIVWLGKTSQVPSSLTNGVRKTNLAGKILSPALADCHTHLVFSGSRHEEFAMRIAGETYETIAKKGGGIVSTVKSTRAATEQELFEQARLRVQSAQRLGVGILEIKSGYGLDWKTELKMLRVIQKLKTKFHNSLTIQSTYLGAHAFPKEAKTSKAKCGYVDKIVDKFLPEIARLHLADACDVFFDKGYFDFKQSHRILRCAKNLGLQIKLHADELANTGGAKLAAELGALSADHLLRASDLGLKAMARAGVVAVILPTTAFYLGLPFARVDKMRKLGVCLALATDFNPGSSPSFHLPFVMSLAVLSGGFRLPEAFVAATYGGARALGLHSQHGHLTIGKKPRIAVFNCESYKCLIQQYAHPGLCEKIET